MPNYILLERIELNATTSSVTFANIPQTGYTDLKVIIGARSTNTGDLTTYVDMLINNDTGSYYDQRNLSGMLNSTASHQSWTNQNSFYVYQINTASSTSDNFSNTEIYIPNYASSTSKSISVDGTSESNTTSSTSRGIALVSGLYHPVTNTGVTSLKFTPSGGSFAQYSTFSLYAIAASGTTPAIAPKATGGNLITTDGTYWTHTFTSSGTFTPIGPLTCDYLVVAGGGGGGVQTAGTSYGQGGGGGGGLRCTVGATGGGGSLESPLSLTTTAYTVTVGSGGATNTSGNNSVFSTITSIGGGRGGNGSVGYSSEVGGSGGGAAGWGTQYNGSAGTANQGYAGGNNAGNNIDGAGGGGGAGQVGYNGVSGTSGQGGNGVQTSISGTATYYAGGGGGGGGQSGTLTSIPGGLGGGGTGGGNTTAATSATAGTINTGGGGGGSGRNSGGGSPGSPYGGSGIVIIRYAV